LPTPSATPPPPSWRVWLQPYRTVAAAAAAGTCGVVIGYPFDFVKTRMQTHGYKTMREVLRTTVQHEGVRGVFRGIVPPLFTVSMVKAISFHTYESTKAALGARRAATRGGGSGSQEALGDAAAAGFVAGTAIALVSGPLELVKVQMQLGALIRRLDPSVPVFRGSVACARYIVQRHGVAGLYKGFTCHFARDALGTALYFWLYEAAHRVASPTGRRADASALVHFTAGGAAGVGCWLVVFPIDLVKSRLQKDACLPRPVYRYADDLTPYPTLPYPTPAGPG
jgi:solute carrier family 25 (mitochondrial carnitine/acylcarnitine transporter), member 20/29